MSLHDTYILQQLPAKKEKKKKKKSKDQESASS